MTLLVGALTGQRELLEEDRKAIGTWTVEHVEVPEVRELLVKIVATQVVDTAEWRAALAEAIREKFRQDDGPD